MSPWPALAYAAIRSGAAIARHRQAHADGATWSVALAQGAADAALAVGIVAFAEPRLAARLGGVLTLLVVYATVWELYAGFMRGVAQAQDEPPGADVTAGALVRPIMGLWGLLGVIPAIVLAALAATERVPGSELVLHSKALTGLVPAVAGVAVLRWAERAWAQDPDAQFTLRGLGLVLVATAICVWW